MFKLSNRADYGFILLSSVARAGKDKSNQPISISKIAKKHNLSTKFLSQIAQDLKKAGFLTSKEGVSGGYVLSKKPKEIKLLDVLMVLEGGIVEGHCFEEDHECVCGAKEMWMEVKKQLSATFKNKTVADLVSTK